MLNRIVGCVQRSGTHHQEHSSNRSGDKNQIDEQNESCTESLEIVEPDRRRQPKEEGALRKLHAPYLADVQIDAIVTMQHTDTPAGHAAHNTRAYRTQD